MVVWVFREKYNGEIKVAVFGTRKQALTYAKAFGLKRNYKDQFGYELSDDETEYSINKEVYYAD